MHVTMSNLFQLFSIDVLDNYFAQQFDQEEGRKEIEILRKKLFKKSKKQKKSNFDLSLFWKTLIIECFCNFFSPV